MKRRTASLGFKLNVALLVFVLALGAATSAIVLIGFNRTQDDASARSREALEEEGKLALKALAGGLADTGALQFETAEEVGQRAGSYLEEFSSGGGVPVYDTSRFARTSQGVLYDPDPGRFSDVIVVNHGELKGDVLDDIAYSAALDPLFPALAQGFPGQVSGPAFNPIAVIYIGVSGVGRYYPPIGIHETTPPEVDVSDFYDRFGPVANPEHETVWTPPYEDLQGRGLVITAQTPVYKGDQFRGVFEVDLSISMLVQLINNLKPTTSGFTFYVDTDGAILQTDAFGFLSSEAKANAGLVAILDAMEAPEGQTDVIVQRVTMAGKDYFIAYGPMAIPGGSIGVAAPVDEVTAPAAAISEGIGDEGNRTLTFMLAAVAALFIAGLTGATYLNRSLLLVPLRSLFAGTSAVAAGNLDTRVELARSDELGELADSFNSMVDKLRESEQHLEGQVEARTRELAVLLDVSRELSRTRDLRELARVMLEQMKHVIDYTGGAAVEFEENSLRVIESMGPRGREPEIVDMRLPTADAAALWDRIRAGSPVVVDDVRDDSGPARMFRATIGSNIDEPAFRYIRSWMAMPLGLEDRVVGMMSLSKDVPGYFTQRHVELAMAIARQAAIAAENARLFEQRERRARELTALLEVSRAVASTLDAGEVISAILAQLGAITPHSGASVLIATDDALEMAEGRSITGAHARPGARIPLAVVPTMTAAMMRGETMIIDDVRADDLMAVEYRAAISAMGLIDQPPFNVIRSWMGVPLELKDRVLGLLTISWREPAYFTEDHARLARAFADQAAVAMENARLFEQTGQVAALEERQRLARELHDSVSQALYGIALGARTARTVLDRDAAAAAEPIEYVLSLAEAGLAEMRALIFELRPESLQEEGLVAALRKQIDATEARYGFRVAVDLCEEPKAPLETKETLYRIAQEALHNIVKHANATEVRVSLAHDAGQLRLIIADNGSGFDPGGDFAGHLGLRSMSERARRRRGELVISSGQGTGTSITATIPV